MEEIQYYDHRNGNPNQPQQRTFHDLTFSILYFDVHNVGIVEMFQPPSKLKIRRSKEHKFLSKIMPIQPDAEPKNEPTFKN
jgi:hypothetical protein